MEAMTVTTSTYPVRVDAALDSHLNRGLWLVKWAMVLPHYVILAFLWTAFVVLSVLAFFAILFTGRYPRSAFEFNVGVLRWTWRVAYYAYGALGTDRYPPFSLQERADYPAHLEIDYPEQLSRGLVLVKWWLLAIPHYLVLAVFIGGGLYFANAGTVSDTTPWLWGGGLIGLLALIAAVVLLFTGRYPREIFDLVLGMNRWVLRVAAYAALMTDAYPPFRLDMGPDDPGSGHLTLFARAPAAPAAAETPASRPWTASRIVAVMVGSTLLLLSGGLLAGGVGLVVADQSMREGGFVTTGPETVRTNGYHVTTANLEFHVGEGAEWVSESLLGDTRLTAAGDRPLFVGIGSTAGVEEYLSDGAPPVAPAQLDLWVAQASGPGEQSLTWTPRDGDWTVVLMNADATPGVTAQVSAGAELPALEWVIPVTLSVGGTLLILSVALITGALMNHRREGALS